MSGDGPPERVNPRESELYFLAGEEPGEVPPPDAEEEKIRPPRLCKSRNPRSPRTVRPEDAVERPRLTSRDRLLLLDAWTRSGLPGTEFGRLVGLSPHTLYGWRKKFEEEGPAGLEARKPGAPKGSRMPEETRRAVLMMKVSHPDWGVDRLHDMLLRTEGYQASAGAIALVLKEEGYVVEDVPTRKHPEKKVRRFERARPNQLWQTDLFTFLLKRENRRVYLVAFLDDHSRFVTGFGLHASSSGALVREAFEGAVANYGLPEEVLTDQGPQYYTWRGKSAFTKLLEKRGVKHLVARAKSPTTLGKIERYWGTLWRELVEAAVFRGLEEARVRIGHFMDFYNFHRTHQGIDGLVPADRFFSAAPEVRKTLEARVAANAESLAKDGVPRKPFYLTGRVGDETLSLHSEGEKVILTQSDGKREEVDLTAPGRRADPAPPGTSPLDGVIEDLGLSEEEEPGGGS
jgi:transposase InsO family protein